MYVLFSMCIPPFLDDKDFRAVENLEVALLNLYQVAELQACTVM